MEFNTGDRVIAVNNGYLGKQIAPKHYYEIGWKGTVRAVDWDGSIDINFDNGEFIGGCDERKFKVLKEEQTMKPGDTVKVKGVTDHRSKYNGMTGKYLRNMYPGCQYKHTVSFDGNDNDGHGCGWLFADSELEVVPHLGVGSKVTLICIGSNAGAMEFKDGTLIPSTAVKFEEGIGTSIAVYEITGDIGDQTIIRRISDGRVFFVQQRFLKEYVAVPKFKQGQFVEHEGTYKRIIKVTVHESEVFYDITAIPDRYNKSNCGFYCNTKESELSEVAQ